MNNETMKFQLTAFKNQQTSDIEQIAKYKALMSDLDAKVRERKLIIDLMEAALNPEKRNDTLAQILGY